MNYSKLLIIIIPLLLVVSIQTIPTAFGYIQDKTVGNMPIESFQQANQTETPDTLPMTFVDFDDPQNNVLNPSYYTSSHLKITLNTDDCSHAISDYMGVPYILKDNYIILGSPYSLNGDSDDWTVLDVNSETCDLYYFDGGFKTVRENDEGIFTLWYDTNSPETKIEAEFENKIYPYHKFSILEEIEFVSPNIEYNSQLVNLSNLKGTSTDKATLSQEDDTRFEISNLSSNEETGVNYNSGDGFPLLWSVDWIDDRRVNLNYGHTVFQTPIGESYFLDPIIWGVDGDVADLDADLAFTTTANYVSTCDNGSTRSYGGDANKITTNGMPYGSSWMGCQWKNTNANALSALNDNDWTMIYDFYFSGHHNTRQFRIDLDNGGYVYAYQWSTSSGTTCQGSKIVMKADSGSSAWTGSFGGICTMNGIEFSKSGTTWTATYGSTTNSMTSSEPVAEIEINGASWNGNYASSNVEIQSLTTLSAPDAPTSLTIDTQDVANEITLNWVTPSDDGGASITGYKIFIGGSQVATTGVVNTYDDTIAGAEIDATLAYTVKAVNSAGDSVASNSVSITSWGVPAQVGTVTGTIGANPALSWSAPSSEATITNYKIYRDGSLHDTISASPTTYSDSTSVVAGTTYAYTVSAVSGVGEGAQSASVNVLAGTPPNPPTSISATIANTATAPLDVTVTWSSPSTVGTGTLSNFQIFRERIFQKF